MCGLILFFIILLCFMYDNASLRFLLEFREFLTKVFPEKWIGRGGPTVWSARSSDLISLYYYLWGRVYCLCFRSQ